MCCPRLSCSLRVSKHCLAVNSIASLVEIGLDASTLDSLTLIDIPVRSRGSDLTEVQGGAAIGDGLVQTLPSVAEPISVLNNAFGCPHGGAMWSSHGAWYNAGSSRDAEIIVTGTWS